MNKPQEFKFKQKGPIWQFKILRDSISRYLATSRGKNVALGLLSAPYIAGVLYHTYVNTGNNEGVISSVYELKDKHGDAVEIESPFADMVKAEFTAYEAQAKPADEECFRFNEKEKKKYLMVYSNDMDYHTLGSAHHREGCGVALPYYLSFSKPDDVDDEFLFVRPPSSRLSFEILTKLLKVDFGGDTSPPASAAVAQLRQSLVLSDLAKSFALRRIFHQANSEYSMLQAAAHVVPACFVLSCYMLIDVSIRRAKFFSVGVRFPMVLFLCALSPIIRKFCDQYVEGVYLASLDTEIIERYPSLKQGAVEFFEKQLDRNKALKEIFDDRSETIFTDDGNAKQAALKLTDRLKFVKDFEVANVAQ